MSVDRYNKASSHVFYMSKLISLKMLSSQVSYCSKCQNFYQRQQSIPGKGNAQAKIMLLNSAPTSQVNKSGDPFVGKYGNLLSKIFKHALIDFSDIYYTFAVKCFPGNSTSIKSQCVKSCNTYLKRQIAIVQPKLIITFGVGSYFALTGSMTPKFNQMIQMQVDSTKLFQKTYVQQKFKVKVLPLLSSAVLTQQDKSAERKNAAIAIIRQVKTIKGAYCEI